MSTSDPRPSDEIWAILKEVSSSQKETDRRIKETDRRIKESDRRIKESDRRIKEWEEEIQAGYKRLQAGYERLQASQLKTDLQIQKQGSQFNERWGKMIETLVSGKCLQLLQERGIQVKRIYPNAIGALERDGKVIKNREFDIIAANGRETVVFEVKTVLTVKSINDFLELLPDFSKYLPEHKGKILYGGMAYLKSDERSADYAEERGLFVIRAVGDSAALINKKDFEPKIFPS